MLPLRFVRFLFAAGALAICATPAAVAQGNVNFQIRVQQGSNVVVVANGAGLTMGASAVGVATSITVTATYTGTTSATFNAQPTLLGSADFSATNIGTLPLTLTPGNSFSSTITYKPTSANAAAAQFSAAFSEAPANSSGTPTAGAIELNLSGTAPSLSVSYFLQSNGNFVSVAQGGTMIFPGTLINTTAGLTVVIQNRGSGAGQVNGINVSGARFQPVAIPSFPATITPGTDLRFGIDYTPTQVGNDTGGVQMDLNGVQFTANLTGSGISPGFLYQTVSSSGTTTTFLPNQVLTLPDTVVGSTSSITIRVQNTGNAVGTVGGLGITTGAYNIADAPITPITLNPNDIFTFTLTFTPTATGANTGTMRIGNDLFPLTGNGLGSKLSFVYGPSSTAVQSQGNVIFSPIQIGQTEQVAFTVTNAGTSTTTISSIAVADTKGVYRLENLPAPPVTLKAGESFTFTIDFAPNTTGFLNTTMQVDNNVFTLVGSGNAPQALPAIQFTGASGNVDALTQPPIGLSLASSYGLDLNGTLTLAVNSASFSADPAIQFSNGSRTVAFTIPANTTQAVFPGGTNQIRLQTGTTAGNIVITPGFTTTAGLDLTPSSPPTLTLTVQPSAPQLLAVVETASSNTSFTLRITGFSTTHSLSKLNFQMTGTSDVITTGGTASLDVSSAASVWYLSAASSTFGGQFAITVPFNLSSSSTSVTAPVSKIQSISVTATNAQGTSNSISVTITP
jgi:hypothetical protein